MRERKRRRMFMKRALAMILCIGMISGMFEGIPVVREYMPRIT